MCKSIGLVAVMSFMLLGGCPGTVVVDADFDTQVQSLVEASGTIQTEPPPPVIPGGNTVIIDNSVTIIDDPHQDIIFEELPDITVIGFSNDTGFDIYVQYFVDGEFQAIYVYAGETLLLEYECLGLIELDTEEDFDPFTGEFVDGPFDLSDVFFENPFDFECGDALLLTFDPFTVVAEVEFIELL